MKKSSIFLFLLFSFSAFAENCPLEGYWLSSEELTLKSIEETEALSQEEHDLFFNDFFGKLYVHMECYQWTLVYEDIVETTKFDVLTKDDSSMTIKFIEFAGHDPITKVVTWENNCYSTPITNRKYREYFCRADEKAYNQALKAAGQPQAAAP